MKRLKTTQEICRQIKKLYKKHRHAPYPRSCTRFERGDVKPFKHVSLVMLDADVIGCVGGLLSHGYTLDIWRVTVLGRCFRHATLVLPHLPRAGKRYFGRVEKMADLVLQVLERKTREANKGQAAPFKNDGWYC